MARTIDQHGEILTEDRVDDEFRILDKYGPPSQVATPRVDWLATISAGMKTKSRDGREIPAVSRDGLIQLHDDSARAPALAEILAAEGYQRLTIAVTSDRLQDVIAQRYVLYSASALLAHGDDLSIREAANGGWVEHPVGSDRYEELRAQCAVSWSLFFVVARWIGQQTQIVFHDGFGQYRLRSASRNSLANVVAKLQEIQRMTGGRMAGIPLDLSITYRDVAGSDGKRRNIPVWTLALKPPEAIQLTSGNFRALIGGALREGEALRLLPAPRTETAADFALELEQEITAAESNADPSEAILAQALSADVACEAAYYERAYFSMVRGTRFESAGARAELLAEYSAEHWTLPDAQSPDYTDSLAEFLAQSTEQEANRFIAHVGELIAVDVRTAQRGRARELLGGPAKAPDQVEAPRPIMLPPGKTARDIAWDDGESEPRRAPSAKTAPAPASTEIIDAEVAAPTETPHAPATKGPLTEKTPFRVGLDSAWGALWNKANKAGIKDHTVIAGLSDEALKAKYDELGERLQAHERRGQAGQGESATQLDAEEQASGLQPGTIPF